MSKADPFIPDQAVVASYAEGLEQHGPTPAALGWTKPEKMAIRYEALCCDIDSGASILDYGCGLGGLAKWLCDTDYRGRYVGVDACKEMIENAVRPRWSGPAFIQFQHVDGPDARWLNNQVFDHVVCCGVFTRMGSRDEETHRVHVRETLAKLFKRCRIGLHVDFMDAMMCDHVRSGEFYAAPWDALALARGMSSRVKIDCSYVPYEFGLHIYRDAAIERPANVYGSAI